MSPTDLNLGAVSQAIALLPTRLDSVPARILLLAIGLQETNLITRVQRGGGPARSFWQFERGGVRGVINHPASAGLALSVCGTRGVRCEETAVYNRLASDDVLGAAFARLLLWTDPRALATEAASGWEMYVRNWRPGKPHPERWPANFAQAQAALVG